MTSIKRKAYRLLSLAFVLVVVIACGGNGNNASGRSAGTSPAGAESVPKSDVKLTLWHWKVGFDPGLKAVAQKFKADTGITVETQAITPDQTYVQYLLAAAAEGTMPDIYLYWSTASAGVAALSGIAANLQGELEADPAWKNSFLATGLNEVTISQAHVDAWQSNVNMGAWYKDRKVGEVYNLPIDIGSNYIIYANAKLLKKAGIPQTAPVSIEAWIEDMKKAKSATGVPALTFGGRYASLYQNWFADFIDYMKNGPESYAALMTGKENMIDPKHSHIGDFLETMSNNELLVPGVTMLDIDPSDQLFANGQAVYSIGGTFTYASLLTMGMNPADIISFRVPAYEGSVNPDAKAPLIPLTSAAVTEAGPYKKEAIQFVKYLTSQEGQLLYANAAVSIPAIKLDDTSLLNPTSRSMLEAISLEDTWWSQNLRIVINVWNQEWNSYYEELQKVMLGKSTAAKANAVFDNLMTNKYANKP
ncbi:hypothetical protein Back11_35110 [Paenibacillus baekrokdamisoli]|uniref:Uncharacterized protein n=1 Tax=Paenibacillus baekrokdamisoli TaxID=1712516 RepID=A0A3G9IUR5_9BACL|nr:extracellular solute-binding protein [Paenibacillus baekrokdamisoli]MBB3070895.1 multiple sugar transport system substrate-binding protein [Paenibacillus baekrokdamisoli]BBH22166.1 hypothetical protein Back11_35110 [Paenibacillus baekrokdamisoli]